MNGKILIGDCRESMRTLDAESVQCVVTSPPYYGLRDYGCDGQIGLETRPDCLGWATGAPCGECFVCAQVEVFREVRRVLRADGVCWVNLGDSYAGAKSGPDTGSTLQGARNNQNAANDAKRVMIASQRRDDAPVPRSDYRVAGLKPKDLMGIPWRVALALQADGWWLRQDIIWSKPNPMPESIKDRCTKAHEYLFLLTKGERYRFDVDAVKEPSSPGTHARYAANGGKPPKGAAWGFGDEPLTAVELSRQKNESARDIGASANKRSRKAAPNGSGTKTNASFDAAMQVMPDFRNKRSVWTVATQAFKEAHFATFPEALIEPCILAGSRPGDVVLDPFMGAGTTAVVCERLGRQWIGCELNPEYAAMAERRIHAVQPGLVFAEASS